jgi:uncharacterized protein (TIGR03437 family)
MLAALGAAAIGYAQELRFTQVASGVSAPTDIAHAGDGSGRLFLVQQNGLVRILRDGALLSSAFLDIRGKTRADSERGLLGLAFPSGFASSRRFYVNYTDLNGDTVIAQYRVSADPDVADPQSEIVLLKIAQPFSNHNGGCLRFGPDGYLYIGMGDGGSGGDPLGNGQNRDSLLGKLLRIDVESDPGHVRIPPDNPFVATPSTRAEIWATGLRNPWRFSFDRATGDLWIADVGQDAYEEVDFQPAASRGGENYGWNRMEGRHCYRPNCDAAGLTLPVAEYSHAEGCSITGGFVYRGAASPGLRGLYIYGDYCSGRIWGVERIGETWSSRLLASSGFGVTTFGEDEAGQLYVANASGGAIYRIEGGKAPRVAQGAVVNAATFAPGISPGSLATVFAAGVLDAPGVVTAVGVPLATSLHGVSVTVGGVAAPIHSLANVDGQEQVNFQTPYEVRGRASVSVVVAREELGAAAVDAPVADQQPAVYSGSAGALVVHNADYSLATAERPLVAGEYAFFYATGLGRARPEPATGAASSTAAPVIADVRVTLGGAPCQTPYAGLAPGLVGVYQVNFRVPAAPSGAQNLVLTADGVAAPPARAFVR